MTPEVLQSLGGGDIIPSKEGSPMSMVVGIRQYVVSRDSSYGVVYYPKDPELAKEESSYPSIRSQALVFNTLLEAKAKSDELNGSAGYSHYCRWRWKPKEI